MEDPFFFILIRLYGRNASYPTLALEMYTSLSWYSLPLSLSLEVII